jgi:hypothetical protein
VSGPLRGSVHDLTAARIWGVIRALAATELLVPADKAYQGAGAHILTPYKGRQPRTRQAPRTRRTRERPAQIMAHPAQATLLPPPRRPPRQSRPHPSTPRDRSTLKKAQWAPPDKGEDLGAYVAGDLLRKGARDLSGGIPH